MAKGDRHLDNNNSLIIPFNTSSSSSRGHPVLLPPPPHHHHLPSVGKGVTTTSPFLHPSSVHQQQQQHHQTHPNNNNSSNGNSIPMTKGNLRFGLSYENIPSSKKSFVLVKLTEQSIKAIEDHIQTKGQSRIPSISFPSNSNHGVSMFIIMHTLSLFFVRTDRCRCSVVLHFACRGLWK